MPTLPALGPGFRLTQGLQLDRILALSETSIVSIRFSKALYTAVPCSFGPTSTESGLMPVCLRTGISSLETERSRPRRHTPRCVSPCHTHVLSQRLPNEVAAAPE